MANFNNALVATNLNAGAEFAGRVDEAYERVLYGVPSARVDRPLAYSTALPATVTFSDDGQKSTTPPVNRNNAVRGDFDTYAADWFETFHVIPRRLDLGNILSTQQNSFEVYSAFRRVAHDWDSFVNNAGAGVAMLNLPTFPKTFQPQSAGGLNLILEVSTAGVPNVDSTLDFVFDVPLTTLVPLTLKRVVLFAVQPERPYAEFLEWLTDVIPHKDGSEQRISPRKNPRQIFEWSLVLEDGAERSRLHNILFDWQSRIFGIPIWHELTRATVAIPVGATTINVQTTSFADYRTTGSNLVLIYQDQTTFDVLPLSAIGATTLTLSSPTLNAFGVGALVCPLRTGRAKSSMSGGRFPSAAATLQARLTVEDNDVDLADASAFSTYKSKVLLDGFNGVRNTMPEVFQRSVLVVDGEVGLVSQGSSWDKGKRVTAKTFLAGGKQGTWEARGVLHTLRGRQVSFYLPSFSEDLTVTQSLNSGSATMTVTNVGYSQFVRERQPRNEVRVVFEDSVGQAPLLRTVLSSVEVDATEETLTLDDTWPSTFTAADVKRVEFVEKLRFDSDRIRFDHELGERLTRISAPVKTVFE